MEYLVTMTTHVPDGISEQAVDDIRTRETAHSRELAAQGHLLRLWALRAQGALWACGKPTTRPRCRRSCSRCRWHPG